jgi:hypothetical protein
LYTVTNNALQNNNQFHFKGIIVNVNHIWESMCNVFAQIFYFVNT